MMGGVYVNASSLRAFCHRSREWSRATRGMELFQMAAIYLRRFADADSGFFVYRKRVLTNGVTPQTPTVYASWGVFAGDEKSLQTDVEDGVPLCSLESPRSTQHHHPTEENESRVVRYQTPLESPLRLNSLSSVIVPSSLPCTRSDGVATSAHGTMAAYRRYATRFTSGVDRVWVTRSGRLAACITGTDRL